MAVFRYESTVDASFEDVWSFYSEIEGLEALTPGWLNLTVEEILGPEGEPDPEVLLENSSIKMSLRPMGIGVMSWTSEITERDKKDDTAYFIDEMIHGPFRKWRHIHSFEREETGTLVKDKVEFSPSLWMGGKIGSPVVKLNLWMMFRYRHRKTRDLLE